MINIVIFLYSKFEHTGVCYILQLSGHLNTNQNTYIKINFYFRFIIYKLETINSGYT